MLRFTQFNPGKWRRRTLEFLLFQEIIFMARLFLNNTQSLTLTMICCTSCVGLKGKVSLQDGLFHPHHCGINQKRIFVICSSVAGQEAGSFGTLTSSSSGGLIRPDSRLRSLWNSKMTVKPSPAMYYTRVDMPR